MDFSTVGAYISYVIYGVLVLIALWGTFCVIMVWRRVAETRFRNEEEQEDFLRAAEQLIIKRNFDELIQICDGDPRALPQLTMMAARNRSFGFAKVQALVAERFQRDVLAELDYRLSWVKTVIKAAPMVGLLGTVVGMLGAFNKLATAESVETTIFASDISLALITTACGLSIAIPLVLAIAGVNIRIGRMEDLIGSGLNRMLGAFHDALPKTAPPR
jgi:biopolymer transport protein ExbB